MTPDAVLTSLAREEIPDCYVTIRVTQGGNRIVGLHAGNHNAEQSVVDSIVPSVDPLRVALERLIDGYFAARRPGGGAVEEAIQSAPDLRYRVRLKWPNDAA